MRFDAYAGSIPGQSPEDVAALLSIDLAIRLERGKARGRFSDVLELADGHAPVAWVGLDRTMESAYFEGKGERTPDLVDAIRARWPARHRATRLDACLDAEAPGAFDELLSHVDSTRHPRVRSHRITPRDRDSGSTVTCGTRGGRSFVRLYEAGKMDDRRHLGRPDWARLELEYRPHKPGEKASASLLTPSEVWGCTEWTRRCLEAVTGSSVPLIEYEVEPPQHDRTTLYLARTFRKHFQRMHEDLGSGECVWREFEAIWRLDDEAKEGTTFKR